MNIDAIGRQFGLNEAQTRAALDACSRCRGRYAAKRLRLVKS